jgi:deoxyribonuclease-2
VESWRHGTGNIDSDCSKPSKVYNIEQVTFKNFNISFPASDDHSKWMASDEKKLICVGDINRQTHQKFRGGGTVCQKAKISKIYVNLIAKVEKCKESESAVPCSFC